MLHNINCKTARQFSWSFWSMVMGISCFQQQSSMNKNLDPLFSCYYFKKVSDMKQYIKYFKNYNIEYIWSNDWAVHCTNLPWSPIKHEGRGRIQPKSEISDWVTKYIEKKIESLKVKMNFIYLESVKGRFAAISLI